jgi:signal transduction histidine kinase
MDHLAHLRIKVRRYLLLMVVIENAILLTAFWYATHHSSFSALEVCITAAVLALGFGFCIAQVASSYVMQPLATLWQAILHLSPTEHGVAAPKMDTVRVGKEVVTSLMTQIYQLADMAEHAASDGRAASLDMSHNFVAQNLPLPLFVLDDTQTIRFANEAAAQYIRIPTEDLKGKNVYMVLDMAFPSEDTFDKWLKKVQSSKATASTSWERVRMNVRDNHPTLLFDLAAYFNRDNTQKLETMLVLFDHTKQYSQDEQAISFIALSVHELRTPLTLLRGYIEVLEDELTGKVDEELQGYMLKMRSMAEQLTSFVNNILNVARIDNDQLELQLQKEDWQTILNKAINMLSLRAKVRGITLECTVAKGLPEVAADRLSISEVISNLVDNAIKYSGSSNTIKIDAHLTKDGFVETTIQDFGLGISTSILPNLFTKFYRDHRNRAQIGGTGLGLYLSKAIVSAHGGNLWVRSKEGEGSVFGFTLAPYAQLAQEIKDGDNHEIVRGAHGWIKNHSLYRR